MATPDDFLTTHKNGVVAINNLNQTLLAFEKVYSYTVGQNTSDGISASSVILTAPGRLVSVNVIAAGTVNSVFYDYDAISTTATSGTGGGGGTATISYTAPYTFTVGDTVVVSGVTPSGYNGSFTITGSTSTSVSYTSSATGSLIVPGKIFSPNTARKIAAVPTTVGTFPIGAEFSNGLYVIIGSGQVLSVTYSLS